MLYGWNPSTSFCGRIRSRMSVLSICGGSGSLYQDSVDGRIGVEFIDMARQFGVRRVCGAGGGRRI